MTFTLNGLAQQAEPQAVVTWTDVVGALGAGGTLVVAVAAAWIGLRQVKEARELRIEQAQPYVFVALQPSEVSGSLMNLVVRNVGATAAFDVRFACTPPMSSTVYQDHGQNQDLSEHALFTEGLPYLPPGGELVFLFDSMISRARAGDKLPGRYEVVVTYKDSHDRDCGPGRYMLDVTSRWGLFQTGVKTVHHVAKELEQLRRDNERLTRQTMRFYGKVVAALDRNSSLTESGMDDSEGAT